MADDAVVTMKHWMAKGLTGMRLFTTGSTMPGQQGRLDHPKIFPGWGRKPVSPFPADDGQWHTGPRKRAELVSAPGPRSSGAPHAGAESLWQLSRNPDVAAGARRRPNPFLASSSPNWAPALSPGAPTARPPETSLKDLVKHGRETLTFPPESDRKWILARNAQTLYPRLAD